MSKKLWQEVEGERQFLIPEGRPLEAGYLEIENSSGDKMMVSEESIIVFLASQEEVEGYQDQAVEETIAELGKAFSSLFQAGKEFFSQAFQNTTSNDDTEESSEEDSDNVLNVDFEDNEEEDTEGLFSGISGIFQESKVEFQSIFQEAKQEFKNSLRDQETAELLKSIGNQIVDFANSLQPDGSESEESSQEEEINPSPDETDAETPTPPPVVHSETPPIEEDDEDSDDAPPSPLSDSE